MNKSLSDHSSAADAENAILKKQVSYFEDLFAKSSLIGFEKLGPIQNNISKNDLEEF
jgi:hypothetical protein